MTIAMIADLGDAMMLFPGDTMMDMRPPASHGIRSIVAGCTLADRSSAAIRQLFGVQDESLFYGSRIAVNYASFAYNAGQTTVGLLALLAGLTGGTASTGISASGVGALIGVPGFALSMGLALAGAYEAGVGINSAVAMAGILGDNIQRRDALRSTADCGGSGNDTRPSGVSGENGTYNRRIEFLNKANDPKLKNIIDQLYRPTASTGDGGTAAKLVEEVRTGTKVTRRSGNQEYPHLQKAIDKTKELRELVNRGGLSSSDESLARYLLNDLYNAIKFAGASIP